MFRFRFIDRFMKFYHPRCSDRPPLLCLLHLERLLRSPFVDQRGEDGSAKDHRGSSGIPWEDGGGRSP